MTTHSPGPWRLETPGLNEIPAVVDATDQLVAFVRVEANARLIAAAPELLEAVEEFLDWAENHDAYFHAVQGHSLARDEGWMGLRALGTAAAMKARQ